MTSTDGKKTSAFGAWSKSIFRILGALLALGVVAYLLYSVVYTNVPDSRLAVAEAIGATASLRDQISERIATRGTSDGVGRDLAAPARINTKFGTVALSISLYGAVRMRSEKPVFDVEMLPSKDNTGATWHCRGTPEESLPRTCRM